MITNKIRISNLDLILKAFLKIKYNINVIANVNKKAVINTIVKISITILK